MDDTLLVRRGEAPGNLERVVDGLLPGKGRLQLAPQRLAFQKLCNRVGNAVLSCEIVDRKNVRMRQRRDRLGFPLKTSQRFGIPATA